VTLGDVLGLVSLVLVVVGLGLTWVVYQLERATAEQHDIEAARGLLLGVQAGMLEWGDRYFGKAFGENEAATRSDQDYGWVMSGVYGDIFRVPAEPIAALLGGAAASRWIDEQTVVAAGTALWKIGAFNELVRQKTDFNGRHLAEIYDTELPQRRRVVLARTAKAQSHLLHSAGVGDAKWYPGLTAQITANVKDLDAALRDRLRWKRLHRLYERISLPRTSG
jgi:hypothetical protein